MSRAAPVVLCLLVLTAGCLGTVDPGDVVSGREKVVAPCVIDSPFAGHSGTPDPETDRLGWEGGVWANDTIRADQSDGLTCAELERVVARTMARVESVRELEFERTPRVEIISRAAFRKQVASGQRDVPADVRAMENAKYEALFMVDEETDAVAIQGGNTADGVAAYYLPGRNEVVFITRDVRTAQVHTGVLAHELVHALQDQHFGRAFGGGGTVDAEKATLGLIEGDANYVEYAYERRCENEWNGTCLVPDPAPADPRSGARSSLPNLGLYLITYLPYSDGPAFVAHVRERRGWAGVNALYATPPRSTEQVIHPDKYPGDHPQQVRVDDRTAPGWSRVTRVGAPNHETVGEAGLFAMFMYPYYASNRTTEVIPAANFRRTDEQGRLDSFDPYNYSHPYSEGWDGDTLVAYRDDAGKEGYVWKLAFDSERDAREFRTGYQRVLDFRGGEAVAGRANVWVVPEGQPFADAFYVEQRGETVVVVNAPTVEELAAVRTDLT